MKRKAGLAMALVALLALVAPGVASAASVGEMLEAKSIELDMVWVAVACVLVFLMQAGFMFLEIGFSRGKNAGTGVAKILVNFAVVTLAWWAVGYAINGPGNDFFGTSGFFFHFDQTIGSGEEAFNVAGPDAMLMLYGLAFCAVSLAIVWGTTLERIKFGAYAIYALVFGAIIYPLIAHAVWGGGLLSDIGGKPVMDFAGSSVVHLTGAVGAFAALLLLGPRIGKYGPDGKPRAIPGHSMPLVGLGVIILWIGWFGFNGGSTFETSASFFGEVMLNTQLAAAAGVVGASIAAYLKNKHLDVGMAGNGAIAGLVGITAPSGFVEYWAAPIIGIVAGVLVVYAVLSIDKFVDDPVGALSAHGLAGIWGTLAVGLFASPRLVVRRRRLGSLVRDLRRPVVQLGLRSARRPGAGGGVHHRRRVRDLDYHVRLHQEDDRVAGAGRGGGRGPRHQLARHVRVSGDVHPAAGVLDRVAKRRQRLAAHRRLAGHGCGQPDAVH